MTLHYSKALVVEAIIDIRVASPTEISVLDLVQNLDTLKERYPEREILSSFPSLQWAFPEGSLACFGMGVPSQGVRYLSKDGSKIFQARNDGFTLSIFPPYQSWEDYKDEARELWQHYVQARQPQLITRLALRYINRLLIPESDKPISHFLTVFPMFSEKIGKPTDFHSRLHFPQPDLEATLLLTQASLQPESHERGFYSLLLDIDIFRDKIPWKAEAENDIWEFLERLRERKNLIFESCLTPAMKELIQ